MRRQLKTRAVILAGRELGESDRVITFLSEELGKFAAVAKGARRSTKRFAGALELFSLVEAGLTDTGRGLLYLDSCDLTDPYPRLRSDVARYAAACYLAELAAALCPEREPAPGAVALLSLALSQIEAAPDPTPWLRLAELRLLSAAGFQPDLCACRRCGAHPEGRLSFVASLGGIVCARCAPPVAGDGGEAVPVSAGTLLLLTEALRLELPRLARLRFSRQALEESAALLTAHLRHTLQRDLKSRKFLEEVGAGA